MYPTLTDEWMRSDELQADPDPDPNPNPNPSPNPNPDPDPTPNPHPTQVCRILVTGFSNIAIDNIASGLVRVRGWLAIASPRGW